MVDKVSTWTARICIAMFVAMLIMAIWFPEDWLKYILTALVLLFTAAAIVGVKKQ